MTSCFELGLYRLSVRQLNTGTGSRAQMEEEAMDLAMEEEVDKEVVLVAKEGVTGRLREDREMDTNTTMVRNTWVRRR